MWTFRKHGLALLILAAAVGLWCRSPALAKKPGGGGTAAYTILPFMPAGSASTLSIVSDINEHGQAVGILGFADGEQLAIHFDIASGVYTTLPHGVDVGGINNVNQVVGSNGVSGLFWNSPTAMPIELPPLDGDLTSAAQRINDAGIVIGSSTNADSAVSVVWRVFRDQDGNLQVDGPVVLPPLLPGADTASTDINEFVDGSAQVVGSNADDAVIWTIALNPDGTLATPDVPLPVGTLGLRDPSWSHGEGINNFGDVCGYSDFLPFVAFADQQPQPLPVPRGTFYGWATDINDRGEIVGTAEVPYQGYKQPPGVYYAYLWKNGARIDLTSQISTQSGWDRLSWATVISNDGLIGGYGRFDVQRRGFILIPNTP